MEIVTTKKSMVDPTLLNNHNIIEYSRIEYRKEYLFSFDHFWHDYALVNSFYLICTLELYKENEESQISIWKSQQLPPHPQERESTRKKGDVSCPNSLKLCLWIRLKRVDSLSWLFPAFLYFENRLRGMKIFGPHFS